MSPLTASSGRCCVSQGHAPCWWWWVLLLPPFRCLLARVLVRWLHPRAVMGILLCFPGCLVSFISPHLTRFFFLMGKMSERLNVVSLAVLSPGPPCCLITQPCPSLSPSSPPGIIIPVTRQRSAFPSRLRALIPVALQLILEAASRGECFQ